LNSELVVRHAQLRSGKICDILVKDGKIAQIGEPTALADRVINAEGNLVTESFVIPHLHLDKVMTGSLAGEAALAEYQGSTTSGAMTAIEIASKVKEHYVESEILDRVRAVLADAKRYGATHMRAFADVDTKAELTAIRALLKAKEQFQESIAVEIVAFPQDGIIREPGAEELLYKAMDLGADVVGGIPWIEHTVEDSRKHIDIAFEIAKKYDADIAMLTDDAGDPELRTTEYLATSTIRNGWTGRVTACHARATSLYNEASHRELTTLLRKAEVAVITDPHTGPLHVRVRELLDAGVTVALGQDDIDDAYYPFGRCNMLEVAFLASHLLWMMSKQDRETLYDMITVNAAKAMRISDYGLALGNAADLVVLDAQNLRDALAYHSAPLHVMKRGVVSSPRSFTAN
jgi:cytosine deaminase